MRTSLSIVGLLACCVLLFACGSEEEQAAKGTATDKGSGVTLEVLQPGKEPRRNLRYNLKAGQTEQFVMDMQMDMAMASSGGRHEMAMPTVRMSGPVEVTAVDDDGYTMRFAFEQVEVLRDRPVPTQTRRQLVAQLKQMEGIALRYRMAPNGAVADMTTENIDQLDPQVKQQMTQIHQSMEQITVPLPDEPVGEGATWRVDQDVDAGTMHLQQTVDYTLTALNEQQAELTVRVEQTAPRQTIEQQGQRVQLEKMEGTGDGRITLAFARISPTASMNVSNHSRFSAEGQGVEMDMTMQVDIYPQPEAVE